MTLNQQTHMIEKAQPIALLLARLALVLLRLIVAAVRSVLVDSPLRAHALVARYVNA